MFEHSQAGWPYVCWVLTMKGEVGEILPTCRAPLWMKCFLKSPGVFTLCVFAAEGKLSKVRLGQRVARRYSLLHLLCCEPLKLHIPWDTSWSLHILSGFMSMLSSNPLLYVSRAQALCCPHWAWARCLIPSRSSITTCWIQSNWSRAIPYSKNRETLLI